MWRGLETMGWVVVESGSCRAKYILFVPSIHQYCIYPAIQFAKEKLFNVIINKTDNGNPIDTSLVCETRSLNNNCENVLFCTIL